MRLAPPFLVALILAVIGTGAAADCVDPGPAPPIAKGATASEAEMAATHTAVQQFVNALQAYQSCLEDRIRSSTTDADLDLKQAWRAQGNAAIDLAHDIAADYADQFKIYKARH